MSLAYKLWKIGSVLTKDDIKKSIKVDPDFGEGEEPVCINIDFTFENDTVSKVSLNRDAILKNKLFFSKKIGGSGTGIYYLYPEIAIKKGTPISLEIKKKKVKISNSLLLLVNTIKNSIGKGVNHENFKMIQSLMKEIEAIRFQTEYAITEIKINSEQNKSNRILENYMRQLIDKKDKVNWNNNLFDILKTIATFPKDNYLVLFSINGETFYELMPEVWENYYKNPFPLTVTKRGFDVFTNQVTEIGFKTDFKVFSYDQYHSSLQHRIDENLPLSKESARNIKFAWIYILDNLVFYYKGLEYVIIPNMISDNKEMLKRVLNRFVKANNITSNKRTILKKLRREEIELTKEIEQHEKKKRDVGEIKTELNKKQNEIIQTDLGIISEFNEQAKSLEEYANSVTLDYLFITVNRTNLSFEIKGTIEDVIPSRMSDVVKEMREYKIEDLVESRFKDREKTWLQDYFSRNELYFALNKSSKEYANTILEERLYLAKLLLSESKIKYSDLLKRFEFNRLYEYNHKKRLRKDSEGSIQEWIRYSSSFVEDENKIIQFLTSINKIQEE